MASKDIEIEIKFPLKNTEQVIMQLDKVAQLVAKDIFQKDTYFIPHHRNFLDFEHPYEWLRLRETEKGAAITYKHFYPENASKTDYCDEFESKIHDSIAIAKILTSLDFKEAVVVEKLRSIWKLRGAEIAIDDVKELGSFIEVEAKDIPGDPTEVKEVLRNILTELNAKVGEEDYRGYPFKILEKKGAFK